jgi:class 3 adenylate cyclase
VNQVMGDGIMALFGAPLAHEDHAVRACYAALAMQAAVKQYAAEVQRTNGVPIQMRVGLNAGEVVVRSIGSDLHMDYTAVGHTTHLAARMQQMAMPGAILIGPDVLRMAEGYVQVTSLGPLAVRGLRARLRCMSCWGWGQCGRGSRPRPCGGSPALSGVTGNWTTSTRPSNGPAPATGRWWRSWASQG